MVFGSRTTIMCSDASAAAAVTLAAGAMVADRCVLLPGVTVGRRCVLGSGSVTRPGRTYASGATMLGSQGGDCVVLDAGSGLTGAVMAYNAGVPVAPLPSTPDKGGADTEHAFGRTFYGSQRQRSAVSWPVPPTWSITAAAMAAYGFGAAADHGRFVLALVITTRFAIVPNLGRGAEASPWEAARAAASFLVLVCCCMVVIRTVTVPLGALASAGAKRLLIGRRVQGNHAWDRSSYCIRWKAYHVLESLLVDLSKLCGSVRGANPPPPHPRPRTNGRLWPKNRRGWSCGTARWVASSARGAACSHRARTCCLSSPTSSGWAIASASTMQVPSFATSIRAVHSRSAPSPWATARRCVPSPA